MTTLIIDIQCAKLLEALIDRRIVPLKWLEPHKRIRDTIGTCVGDLREKSSALDVFLKQKQFDPDRLQYFDCKRIMELLLETPEAATKNFFGQYTSPLMKNWHAVIRAYERNNLFAAEAARLLAHNTAYEIPFLKKSIQQNEKQVTENNRKIVDLKKSIAEYQRRLSALCGEYGIQGQSFREELQRLPNELPALFEQIAQRICSPEIAEAMAYHEALQVYLRNTNGTDAAKETSGFVFFEALKELFAAPDVDLKDFERSFCGGTGADLQEDSGVAEIDWDISLEDTGAVASIDEEGVATIDWGIETVSAPDDTASSSDQPVEIDWDISIGDSTDLVEEVSTATGEEKAVVVSEEPSRSKLGLLAASDFRNRIHNDLLELEAFLQMRKDEFGASDNLAFANQFQGSSDLLEQQSVEMIARLETWVAKALSSLTEKRLQQLLLLQSSEKYLDRQVASLDMLVRQTNKCRREIKNLEDKNMELVDNTTQINPQIGQLVQETLLLKRDLERALPPLFRGSKVNIIGDINNL